MKVAFIIAILIHAIILAVLLLRINLDKPSRPNLGKGDIMHATFVPPAKGKETGKASVKKSAPESTVVIEDPKVKEETLKREQQAKELKQRMEQKKLEEQKKQADLALKKKKIEEEKKKLEEQKKKEEELKKKIFEFGIQNLSKWSKIVILPKFHETYFNSEFTFTNYYFSCVMGD